jgi:hypothetical protein
MIVYVNCISSFKDYGQGVDERKIREELPEICPQCKERQPFWKHGRYNRQVKVPGDETRVEILRFICKWCSLTISCLYKFLVAYRHYASEAVAVFVERYAQEMTSYRELAWSQAEPSACTATAYRWIAETSRKSEQLLTLMQKEMVAADLWQEDLPVQIACPNAGKAANTTKRLCLDKLASVVATGKQWFGFARSAINCLHEYMVAKAETCLSILSGHKQMLSAPQKMQHLNF